MCNHLVLNLAGIAAQTSSIQPYGSMKSSRSVSGFWLGGLVLLSSFRRALSTRKFDDTYPVTASAAWPSLGLRSM
jgi:hypothetical protein